MKFAYEDLSPEQFEDLVVAICQFLLGAGLQPFATGADGGRDAKFVGRAELIPSKADPWEGTVIVQSKHTNGHNKTFSDPEFYSQNGHATVLGDELPRIKKLVLSKSLDHYMIFSNRRLAGNAESNLRRIISTTCGIPESSILLAGLELVELWLKRFPDASRIAGIDPIDSPLIVSPDDLAEVVEHMADHMQAAGTGMPDEPTDRVSYERKNEVNKMSHDFALHLRRYYLKDTAQIKSFLAQPGNSELLGRYESAVAEFQEKIIAKRKDYQTFDELWNYLLDLLFGRDPILRSHKRLTRTLLFYMYWNCDVGLRADATT